MRNSRQGMSNPADVRIYGTGARMLSKRNDSDDPMICMKILFIWRRTVMVFLMPATIFFLRTGQY